MVGLCKLVELVVIVELVVRLFDSKMGGGILGGGTSCGFVW